jgi:hypothetical protein
MPAGRVGRTPPNLHKECRCGGLEGTVPMGPVPLSVEAWRDEATYTGRSPICLTPRRRLTSILSLARMVPLLITTAITADGV